MINPFKSYIKNIEKKNAWLFIKLEKHKQQFIK